MKTTKSGRISDLSVLTGDGRNIEILPKHHLTIDINFDAEGIIIHEGASLIFERKRSSTLKTSKNIICMGRLIMNPLRSSVIHQIQFVNINEANFVGGGHDVMDSDVGLWVINNGTLDIQGTVKNAYSYLKTGGLVGDTLSVLNSTGWLSDDEIVVAPTKENNFIFSKGTFKDFKLQQDHPSNKGLTAEVLNLTRNVIISGTATGRSHIMIMSNKPQVIRYCQLRHMGPRKNGQKVLGRYALHLHHLHHNSMGTLIQGVVVLDCGSHCFVNHASHGITNDLCIAYNVNETPFWWDPPLNIADKSNNSNDIIWKNCIAAGLYPIPAQRGFSLSGFFLGSGLNNEINTCTVIANMGRGSAGGFTWPEDSNRTENLWKTNNLITHNCYSSGIRVWQNDDTNHLINDFTIYNCSVGIFHGAYRNGYTYTNGIIFNCTKCEIELHALPSGNAISDDKGYKMAFRNIIADKVIIMPHTLYGATPVLFIDCKINTVLVSELPPRVPNPPPSMIDFVNCSPFSHIIEGMQVGSLHRIQTIDGDSWSIDHMGTIIKIENFY